MEVLPSTAEATSAYQQRKEQGLCTWGRCGRPTAEDSLLCSKHRGKMRKHKRDWIAKVRAAREAAGLCIWCPESGPPAPATPGQTSCLPCRVRRRRLPRSVEGVENDVDKLRAIAARTRLHADGRTRYHGQGKKGQQPKAQLLAQDARLAGERFEAFAAGVALLGSDEAKTWTRGERERVEKAIASCGENAVRHIDGALERVAHFGTRHGRREGE